MPEHERPACVGVCDTSVSADRYPHPLQLAIALLIFMLHCSMGEVRCTN